MSIEPDNQTPFDVPRQGDKKNPPTPVTSKPRAGGGPERILALCAALWDMPKSNQLALSAVGGALAVLLVSGLVSQLIPRVDTNRLRSKHPNVTFTQPANPPGKVVVEPVIDEPGQPASGINRAGNQGGAPVMRTEVMQPPRDNDLVYTGLDPSQAQTEEDRKRLELRQREEQIIAEKRLLEDKKRAIERQIEDKQLEEQRAGEDKKRFEERAAQDKQAAEQKQQEEKRKLEEEQRKLDEEHRKIAEVH